MKVAVWSLIYWVPVACYVYWALTRRHGLWDPILMGGAYLGVLFLLEPEYGSSLPAPWWTLLHGLCAAAYWCGALIGHWSSGVLRSRTVTQRSPLVVDDRVWCSLLCALLTVSAFILIVQYRASFELLLQMRHRPDLQLGSITAQLSVLERLAEYLKGYLLPLGTLSVFVACRRRVVSIPGLAVLLVGVACWLGLALGSGSRGSVLSLWLGLWMAARYARNGSPALRRAIQWSLVGLAPALATVVVVQTLYRYTGLPAGELQEHLQSRVDEAWQELVQTVSFQDEVEHVLLTYPDNQPYLRGYSFWTLLCVPVPRPLWPEKPVAWGRQLAWQRGYRYDTTVSLAATLPGEGYANFGVVGWALLPGLVGLATGACRWRLKFGGDDFDLMVGLWGVCWALALRGDLHSAMVSIVGPYALVIVALRVFLLRAATASGATPAPIPASVPATG